MKTKLFALAIMLGFATLLGACAEDTTTDTPETPETPAEEAPAAE